MEKEKILEQWGKEMVQRAMLEIGATRVIRGRKARRVATDTLRNSLFYTVTKTKKSTGVELSSRVPYSIFIHEGVNGTKVHVGSPFTFKKQPPVEVVQEWMRVKKIRVRNKDGAFVKQTPSRIRGLAFVLARSIKEKGIEGLPFYRLAFAATEKKYTPLLLNAVWIDGNDTN